MIVSQINWNHLSDPLWQLEVTVMLCISVKADRIWYILSLCFSFWSSRNRQTLSKWRIQIQSIVELQRRPASRLAQWWRSEHFPYIGFLLQSVFADSIIPSCSQTTAFWGSPQTGTFSKSISEADSRLVSTTADGQVRRYQPWAQKGNSWFSLLLLFSHRWSPKHLLLLLIAGWTLMWSSVRAWNSCWMTQTSWLTWTPTQGQFLLVFFPSTLSETVQFCCWNCATCQYKRLGCNWSALSFRRVAELFMFDFEISGIHLDDKLVRSCIWRTGELLGKRSKKASVTASHVCRGRRLWLCTWSCWTWTTSSCCAHTCPTEWQARTSLSICIWTLHGKGASSKWEDFMQIPQMTWWELRLSPASAAFYPAGGAFVTQINIPGFC